MTMNKLNTVLNELKAAANDFSENYERFGFSTAFNELDRLATVSKDNLEYFTENLPMQISATPEFQRWATSWLKHFAKQN